LSPFVLGRRLARSARIPVGCLAPGRRAEQFGRPEVRRQITRIRQCELPAEVTPQTGYNTKGTPAHTHRELIREWLWEPKGISLEYI